MVPDILYLPSAVKVITLLPSAALVSVASAASRAALTNPCGVSQIWSCRLSALAGCATGPLGPIFHALSPLTWVFCSRDGPGNVGCTKVSCSLEDFCG